MEQNVPNSRRLMTWFQEVTVPAADLLRSVIPPDQLTYVAFSCLGLGMLFFCAMLLSFWRIRFSMRRDGKNAPSLTLIWVPGQFFLLCNSSQKKLAKMLQNEAETEINRYSWMDLRVTDALPYVKSIDRFFTKAAYLLPLACILLLMRDWLYPGYTPPL